MLMKQDNFSLDVFVNVMYKIWTEYEAWDWRIRRSYIFTWRVLRKI